MNKKRLELVATFFTAYEAPLPVQTVMPCVKCGGRLGAQTPYQVCETCRWTLREGTTHSPKGQGSTCC